MNFDSGIDFLKQTVHTLMSSDSPTGFTQSALDQAEALVQSIGYPTRRTRKGNLVVSIEGREESRRVGMCAHLDTLGLMVRSITDQGRLMFTALGAPLLPSLEGEYCRIYTKSGACYTGTILSLSPAIHVFPDASTRPRDEKNMAVTLDELVHSREEVLALGIRPGDFICFDPKTTFTESGYLKSRFIDDKGSVSLLITLLKLMKDANVKPRFHTEISFTVYEEVGHGASAIFEDVEELLVVDMGCVGDDLTCTEEQVSICAKDSCGPYDYGMVSRLVQLAEENDVDFALDIYPRYSSDASAYWHSGHDTPAALIGPGVYGSHGMERTHLRGLLNTMKLAALYLDLA